MLGRLGVRGKILAVVMVPILVLIIGAGAVVFQAARSLNDSENVSQLLDLVGDAHDLVDNLQAERDFATNYVHTYQNGTAQHAEAAAEVDESLGLALTIAEGSGDARLTSAASRILELTGLATERDDEGNIVITEQPDVPRPDTLYALRGTVSVEIRPNDWPVWPSDDEVLQLAADYAQLRTDLGDVVNSVPSGAFADAVADANFNLSRESNRANQALALTQEYQTSLDPIFAAVNGSLERFNATAEQVSTRESNTAVNEAIVNLSARFTSLETTRLGVTRLRSNPTILSGWYSGVIDQLVDIAGDVALIADDAELTNSLRAFAALDTLVEAMQREKTVNERIIRQGEFGPNDAQQTRRAAVETDLALEDSQETVDALGGDLLVPGLGASLGTAGDQISFVRIRDRLSAGTDANAADQQSVDWPLQVQEELAVYAPLRDQVWRAALDRSAQLVNTNLVSTLVTAVGAAAVVGASLVIALLIARRIVGPLRRLTTTATAVRQELPRLVERVALPGQSVDVSEVQIPVESADEVGRLAEAFNSVNAATLAIAGEQAALRGSISEMFVNVARRDQVLLNRQLASIDEMERSEEDADTLQRLFALDHLATRMRRNSESLLVLAGIDTGRRMRRPMPLSDVIRTASSEIELYERVQLELDADPSMLGHSSLTAAHLFAEILENATVFSDPGTPVVVRTSASDTSVSVEIQDQGIGMTEDELREAQERVVSTAASEILGAQRLGLFVVGRIARRIGATVNISSTEGEGTSVTVVMPRSLFDDTFDEIAPAAAAPVEPEQALPEFADAPDASTVAAVDNDAAPLERSPIDDAPAAPASPFDAPVTADAFAAGPPPEDAWSDSPASELEQDQVPAAFDVPAPTADEANRLPREETSLPDVAPGLETPPPGLPTQGNAPAPTFVEPPSRPAPEPVTDEDIPLPSTPSAFEIQTTPAPAPGADAERADQGEPVAPAGVPAGSVDDLIAADAQRAPEAQEVDTGALTSGQTPSGLPSRRRRGGDGEAGAQTTSILGMPERPNTQQLDVLNTNGDTGFVPQVSQGEAEPLSAEQRSSMFRGFQARRADYDGPALEPDAESFGHMQRRAAVAADVEPEDDETDEK